MLLHDVASRPKPRTGPGKRCDFWCNGSRYPFRGKEFGVLRYTWRSAGHTAKAKDILQQIWGLQPRDIPLSPEGKKAWTEFYNAHAKEEAELAGDLAAAFSKLEGYAARFALLVHLIRSVSHDSSLADHDAVDEQSIAAGVALSNWFGAEARRVYAIIGGSSVPELDHLREIIRIKGGRTTARELMQASRRYRGSATEAEAALARLVNAGYGTWGTDDHGGGPGRPVEVFQLAAGHGNTNTKNAEE